ncbi:MAG: hypothetical protein BWY95_02800 [Bacteroidetes bacterium ADurb.BinA104]|nr:MAG: hypothetical protein BWY95_02800 [Bacteroidetes bacterium ADurb.BinA104]
MFTISAWSIWKQIKLSSMERATEAMIYHNGLYRAVSKSKKASSSSLGYILYSAM